MKRFTIVKGKAKKREHIKKIIEFLGLYNIERTIDEEVEFVYQLVKEQRKEGHKLNMFYPNYIKGIEVSNYNGEIISLDVLDWEYNSKQLDQLAKYFNINKENIDIVPLKSIL